MKVLDRVVAVVTRGDADLWLLLVFSLVLMVVDLFAQSWTTALFAAILGAFALSMMRLRHDVGRMTEERLGLASIFMEVTPSDVLSSIRDAKDLLLVGVSLDRTLRNGYKPLETFLQRGGRLRALVVDPSSEVTIGIADRRAYHEQGVPQRRAHIEASLGTLRQLGERTGNAVELRLTDDPLAFGAIMIDATDFTGETQIVVQHYSYKKEHAIEPNPVFVIRPSERKWFAEFREELENRWRDGTVIGGPRSSP